MIRINLLPSGKTRIRRLPAAPTTGDFSNTTWAVIYGAAAALWLAILGGVYFVNSSELGELVAANRVLQERRNALQQKTQGLAQVEGRLEQSRRLEQVVGELEAARTGPTRAVMELSRLLSTGGGPTINPEKLEEMRRDNPLAGFNDNWDVRRLWLTTFEEVERECRIAGQGRTNEDVAEFLRRLTLSDLFDNVTLQRTQSAIETDTGIGVVGFDITCRVNY